MKPDFNPAQKLAIRLAGRDLLVTAGAGTGKTTVLVERILEGLRSGRFDSLEDLLVVTFTDKAAREMRERIYRGLREEDSLRRHLPHLPRAAISTIHGFCARFLREHFVEAAIEPAFRVLDEHGSTQMIDDALRRVFHDWYRHEDRGRRAEFQSLVEMASVDREGENLRRIVRTLYEYARATEEPGGYLEKLRSRRPATRPEELPWWEEAHRRLFGGDERGLPFAGLWARGVRLYEATVGLLETGGAYKTDKFRSLRDCLRSFDGPSLATAEGLAAWRGALASAGCGVAEPDRGLGIRFPSAPRGANDEVPGFRELHQIAKDTLGDDSWRLLPWDLPALLREDEAQCRALGVLIELVIDLQGEYDHAKSRQGLLDFGDLEVATLRVLRAQGERLRGRYREILIDEFQDVNGLQNEILTRLATAGGIFRVGDVKQSIYQFRLADPTIFLGLQRSRPALDGSTEPPADGTPLSVLLAENHRSRPPVLRFANRVFHTLFDEATIGTSYEAQALNPKRAEESPVAPVELHLLARPPAPESAVRAQARYVAERIASLIRDEAPMLPAGDGRARRAGWKDVAILLRAKTQAGEFLEALRAAGIPAYLGTGGSLLDEEPVRDLRALLTVVDNPRDDIALAALLRSPLFGFRDSELLRMRLASPGASTLLDAAAAAAAAGEGDQPPGRFVPEELRAQLHGEAAGDADSLLPESLRNRIGSALQRIDGWRALHGTMELTRFLARLLEESGMEVALRATGEYRARRAALGKFLDLARAYEEERGPALHGFLARIEALAAGSGIDAVPEVGADDDAVVILTMHKAKGLEYPIVVLPRLEWTASGRDRLGARIRIGPAWVGTRTLNAEEWTQQDSVARQVLAQMQAESARAEEKRILYVALTRARERLILIGSPKKDVSALRTELETRDLPAALIDARVRNGRSALDWIAAALVASREPLSAVPLRVEWPVAAAPSEEAPPANPANAAGPLRREKRLRRPKVASAESPAALDRLLAQAAREPAVPPFARLEGLRGKYWVTELKSLSDAARRDSLEADDGAEVWRPSEEVAPSRSPEEAAAAARRGILYHAALARLDFARASEAELDVQFAAFAEADWWQGTPRDAQLEAGTRRFLAGPAGERLRRAAASGAVEREVSFTLRLPVVELLPILSSVRDAMAADPRWQRAAWRRELEQAWVIVQGRLDCVFREPDGRWALLDWKSDRVTGPALAARVQGYEWQMKIYRRAVQALWGDLAAAWLVFLHSGEVIAAE